LAIASAAMSVFWTFGGTWLLDTIGGSIEKLARTRSLSALALGTATSQTKIGAGLLALATGSAVGSLARAFGSPGSWCGERP
jgi:hypothetical protein